MYRLENFKEQIKKQRGFLLVDSIVAVVVLAIGLVAIARLYMYGTDYRYRAANRQKAVQIAAERIERLKEDEANEASLSEINDTINALNSDSEKTVTLSDEETFIVSVSPTQLSTGNSLKDNNTGLDADENIYPVTVKVTWPKDKNDHSIALSTYIKTSD